MGNYPFFSCDVFLSTPKSDKRLSTKARISVETHRDLSLTIMNNNSSSPVLEERRPIFQITHVSFDDFEEMHREFSHNTLFRMLKDIQKQYPIDRFFFQRLLDVYTKHFSIQRAELHRMHWFFDARWRDILKEFHYPVEAMGSVTSPALKMFRNLRLRSRILITDEKVLNILNIIREDLEEDNNRVKNLLKELTRLVNEKIIPTERLKTLTAFEIAENRDTIVRIIRNFIILPLKDIITFLYDRVIRMVAHSLTNYNLEEQIYAITEQFVFRQRFGIFETIQNILFFENHENRKLLRENKFEMKEFQDLKNEKYDIDDDFRLEESFYAKPIEMLKRITKKRSSWEKVRVLYEIHEEVADALRKIHHKKDVRELMSADNLVPLFIFLINKAKNCNLHQDVEFCQKFARESLDGDYLFCVFNSALEYVTLEQ